MLQVLGETFKKVQTSNINLVISRPESDSLVTQVDIEGVGWMGGWGPGWVGGPGWWGGLLGVSLAWRVAGWPGASWRWSCPLKINDRPSVPWLKAGGRVPSHLILFLHTSTQMAEDFENDLSELAQLWKQARKDAVHLIGVHR